jgi:hypothetical protein
VLFIQQIWSQISRDQIHEVEIPKLKLEEAIEKHVKDLHPTFDKIAWEETKKAFEPLDKKADEVRELYKSRQKKGLSRLFKKTSQEHLPFEAHPIFLIHKQFEYGENKIALFEAQYKAFLSFLATRTKIRLVYDKNEQLPILEESDIAHLLDIFARNVKAKIKKPWHILVTFHIPEEDYVRDADAGD